uniref:Uncharacterized protein LOC111102383 isoform X2 n=1 Tax=Crassostrea virginica TaxID=6565 RepID=A0A8B8AHZ9_CRAVI|nr:uncharacterized protein LOC111102383 isoform X2 [Crassostrea virginica]
MPYTRKKDTSVSTEEKLKEIGKFCAEFGYKIQNLIENIVENLSKMSETLHELSIINMLWKSIEGLRSEDKKTRFVHFIQILGGVLALIGIAVPPVGIVAKCVSLVVYFLKIAFHRTDIKESLKPVLTNNDAVVHELAGLAERLDTTEIFINQIDVQEHVDEATLQGLISHVDIHIAVDQLGNLKSRIYSLMTGGQDNLQMCLHLLTLFVRISTLRHSLLFRFMACLRLKKYSPGTVTALEKCLEKERLSNQSFLQFFSLPSLKTAAVLTVFDPLHENVVELVAYMKELRLPLHDLKEELHDRNFLIKPLRKPSIVLGRPFPSVSSIRAMKRSTDVCNARVRFRFIAVDGEFNLFYIRSPDLKEYMYMKENTYCKYDKMSSPNESAMWRVIRVKETDNEEETHSCFIFCTKKWPDKIIFIENTYYQCAKGREDATIIGHECLFTLTPLEDRPVRIPILRPGDLTVEPEDCPEEKTRLIPTGDCQISIPKPSSGIFTEMPETYFENRTKQTPNPADFSLSDEEKSIPALKRIQIFLEKHDMRIEKEIEQIENFLSKDENNTLHCSVKRITESLTYLDEDEFNDQTLHGILEIMSINFQLFQEKLPFGSILRKLLRVCGLILSSVWQANKIENFMCSRTEPGFSYETSVAKDIRDLKRFASVLREIENADNILERNIAEMRREGKFCEELPCLTSLKENAKSQSSIMLTSVKVSILQLSVLWQMYAVSRLPGHSDSTANHLQRIILSQRDNDIKFYENHVFPESSDEMSLVKEYMSCLGGGFQSSETKAIAKLTAKRKLNLMSLVVIPLLEEIFKKRFDWLMSKKH